MIVRLSRLLELTKTPVARWALRAALCLGVVGLLIGAASSQGVMAGIQGGYAHATGWILNLLGEDATVVGNTVQTSQFGISVVTACTGIFLTGLFAVAVIALPSRLRATLIGVALGVAGIAFLNLIRLVSLYYIGVHWPAFLDTAHLIVWQSLLIFAAVTMWMLWAGGRHGRLPREAVAK